MLCTNIDVERNSMGNVSQIIASRADQAQWTAAMQYNELGQEIERILPGNVISQWQYDITGRPTNHRISSQNRHTRRRVYQWDVNHRLKGIVNELTAGRTTYGYDEFSNLVWSNQGNRFDFLHRNVDNVGNLYETKEKTDRVYGARSRLFETRDAKFSYDEEGKLVRKIEKNGDTWKYENYGNGMMSKVIRPDQTEVTFKYDPMGRRVEKRSYEKTIQFVWDGNTILHEYFSHNDSEEFEEIAKYSSQNNSEIPDNIVIRVFNDGFVPSAKITSKGNFSIISDYLGTPVEAYDEEGKKVWSAELDIYGRVNEFTGEQDFIPFRYQGQYEDAEIGLYYNRFRYYDPEQGNYTQIDPIGLAGGNPTLYGYVQNPLFVVDPFGLDRTELNKNLGGTIGDGMEALHLIPKEIWRKHQTMFDYLGMGMDLKSNGILLPSSNSLRMQMGTEVYHRGSHLKYSKYVNSRVNKIESKWSAGINDNATIKRLEKLQNRLKGKIKAGEVPREKISCHKLG
ncbi:RHS repeat-associated core domain-containing protein [Solibacillus sp. FSL K6-1523]|uniref:RHS repeat-associated core domain-containing protein n=1 Tax=Solibacillus sp. FSL K6-1523 TaxID=2921471 RepID=UPI0030F91BB2